MKIFVIFYLMLGALTPSIYHNVQKNGIATLSPFGPKTSGWETFGIIALGLLLVGLPLAHIFVLIKARRANEVPPEDSISFLVFVVMSYLMGLGFGHYYGI